MTKNQIKHLITGDELDSEDINKVLSLATKLKNNTSLNPHILKDKHVALIFDKQSFRTRFSFTAAINQLSGHVIESISNTRKSEEPKDLIRVVQGYCNILIIRTFNDSTLAEMKKYSKIPIINALTDMFHPCQSLADLMTLKEHFKTLDNLKIAYIGDGNNVLHSLIMMATKMGVEVHYCCPKNHEPNQAVLEMLENKELAKAFVVPKKAVKNCNAIYTDVWTSMGFKPVDEADFNGYQINEELMAYANDNAIFMHCMPMERGKEVSVDLPDSPYSVIFQQSENRMHVQKALLIHLLS